MKFTSPLQLKTKAPEGAFVLHQWTILFESVPAQHDLAGLAGFHQVETFLEAVDRQLVGHHLAQREAGQYQLGHLVPGLVHLAAVDSVWRSLEYAVRIHDARALFV